MKPFFLLFAVFCMACAYFYIFENNFSHDLCGRIALSSMLIFTSFGHFKFSKGMMLMVPDFLPGKKFIVYSTGILELLFAVMIFIPTYRYYASLGLIAFLIFVFPANINAAFNEINIERADNSGSGPSYLWFRIPMQFILLLWIWVFCL